MVGGAFGFASRLSLGTQIWGSHCWRESKRERDDKANQPEMDKSIDSDYIFSLRFSPFMNPYHFAGNTDVTWRMT